MKVIVSFDCVIPHFMNAVLIEHLFDFNIDALTGGAL